MRLERQILQAIGMVVVLLVLGGCGADSNDRVTTPRNDLTLPEALDGYWPAQNLVAGTLDDLDAMWLEIEAGVEAGEDVTAQVEQYAATCEAAAELFDDLLDLEEVIVPYGDDKGYFSPAAKGATPSSKGNSRTTVPSHAMGSIPISFRVHTLYMLFVVVPSGPLRKAPLSNRAKASSPVMEDHQTQFGPTALDRPRSTVGATSVSYLVTKVCR